MRDRRPLLHQQDEEQGVVDVKETAADQKKYRKIKEKKMKKKGILTYLLFLLLVLGVPVFVVTRYTPFFVFKNIRCRMQDRFWSDRTTKRMEEGYARYFSEPPLYPSEAYNRTMFWGTYEPSRIFAMKSMSEFPITVGFAWYDKAGLHPLRHFTPYMHNKVRGARNAQKRGKDPEVMTVRWVSHDGIHYGKESVSDPGNNARLDFEFLKSPSGNAWHVRVHGEVSTPSPFQLVIYITHADTRENIEVLPPDTDNDGDWSPLLQGYQINASGMRDQFQMRVFDDHNPFYDTAPWRIHGLNRDVDEGFSLRLNKPVGGTPAERAKTDGKGITGGLPASELQSSNLDLRRLPEDAYTYIFEEDKKFFRPKQDKVPHNIIVMKKSYDSDFRLELSFSPAFDEDGDESTRLLTPHYSALSTCQLKNTFRRREKAIFHHVRKIFRPWVNHFNVSAGLYEHTVANVLSEAFGSLYYGVGKYFHFQKQVDQEWDRTAEAVEFKEANPPVEAAKHTSQALAAVGSRTDEPFGQMYLTGLQSIFFVRWNKEITKHVVGEWLLGTQDPQTGFVPSKATFNSFVRSLTPLELRYEHLDWASQPTILLGLQELLYEMQRKGERASKSKNKKKMRNRPEYLSREEASDRAFLQSILPALRRWRSWWHSTQCGGVTLAAAQSCVEGRRPLEQWPKTPTGREEDLLLYRWRSRTGYRIPASGLEDYTRPICPSEHQIEAHVDLFSWVAFLSSLISQVEAHLGLPESVSVDWEAYLNAAHWDEEAQRYADRKGCVSREFSGYVGYVNLFPVMLGIVRKDTAKVQATLKLAREELWSERGLMSASFASVRKAREEGIQHDNLFTGYVWPSINLIWLYSLQTVYWRQLKMEGAHDMYEELHLLLSETIRLGSRWWEYYNPLNGRGEGSKTYIGTRATLLGILDDFS